MRIMRVQVPVAVLLPQSALGTSPEAVTPVEADFIVCLKTPCGERVLHP